MNPNPMHGRAKIARIRLIAQIATPLGWDDDRLFATAPASCRRSAQGSV